MSIDISQFLLHNSIDTCAVWNILSSRLVTTAVRGARCSFAITAYVHYEALHKPRSAPTPEDRELQARLSNELGKGLFVSCRLSIDDLQDFAVLQERMRLGKGELAALAFAKKAGLAFLTDDQKARRLGATVVASNRIQTTPHLFGWLVFCGLISDGDKGRVIDEHKTMRRPLAPYLEEMYMEALRCRLAAIGRNLGRVS